LERLGQAVRLAIDHAVRVPSTKMQESDEPSRPVLHASVVVDAYEEIDQ
jgi:hypothetical protein